MTNLNLLDNAFDIIRNEALKVNPDAVKVIETADKLDNVAAFQLSFWIGQLSRSMQEKDLKKAINAMIELNYSLTS